MRRFLLAVLLLLFIDVPVFADSAVFHIEDFPQEDAYASTGRYDANGFDDPNGWQLFGYSPNTLSYHNAYWKWPLTIPRGSTVTRAFVTIYADYSNYDVFNAAFVALVPDNKWETVNGFNAANYANGSALNAIPRQGIAIEWNNIAWWTKDNWYKTPDITELVQARVDNVDYDPQDMENRYFGLALYRVSGSSYRTGTQEPDNNSFTAKLYVEWTPGPDTPSDDASATFFIANANEEDTYSATGRYNINGFDNGNGWQFAGYSAYTASYYNAYWRWVLTIPKGATVVEARMRIRADYTNGGPLNAAFMALMTDDKWETSRGFNTINYPSGTSLNAIPRQGVPIQWNGISDWFADAYYEGPDMAELVQARIDNADYDPQDVENRHFGLVLYYVSGSGLRTGTQEPDQDSYTTELWVRWIPPNECPAADAGPDTEAAVGETVQLDGSFSEDFDGDPLVYTWYLAGKPHGSSAALSDPKDSRPSFKTDLPGTYVAELFVNDGICESEPDACTVTASVVEYVCPKGLGFWKNRPAAWPVDTLVLGSQTYSKNELLAILKMPVRGDASLVLARQLIPAKLNVAHGSDPLPIEDSISSADGLLSAFTGKLPYKVKTKTSTGKAMTKEARELNNYNSGWLTPACEP
ncbi:MAG: hypothetical protein C4532_14630 [Candidatus Abyssobacteria bacterium SURF_17]|uniref:PKD domain-containing protein n=1 Tax=Candidatus Abyssobacteria bacterium SURF_17 TaxID=2093361 RepID=A0A419ETT3_9BACT|nr:MAG: hypothetical protein C4532_14630 [Candidatus Abyssubacteria bacterium SURF_17]